MEILWSLAMLGGALGGALVAGRNYVAGFLGGIVAGYFFAIYGLIFDREAMSSVQFLLIQFVGTVPGYALYRMLRRDESDAAVVSELTR